MGLQGNLRTMMLPDVLQWLSQGHKTGILHVRGGRGITKKIYFDGGSIISTTSSDPREYLGQFLISRGYLTEDQLNKAMETQIQTGIRLGRILMMVGIIEEPDLEAMLRLKAQENIYDLFLWEEGDFWFEDLARIEEGIPIVHLDVMSIVMEGIRRKDEWGRLREAFPNDWAVLTPTGKPFSPDDFPPTSLASRALEVLDGQRSLAEAVLELHTTEFHLAEAAFHLLQRGLVTVSGEKIPPVERSYESIQRGFLEEASKALEDKRFREAANLYRYLSKVNPEDDEVRRGLALAEEGMSQAFFRDEVPLSTILELAVPMGQLIKQDLTPQEGYLASRINGSWDIASILKVSPLAEREALKAIRKLLDRGVLRRKSP
jgi:hypothetical protein